MPEFNLPLLAVRLSWETPNRFAFSFAPNTYYLRLFGVSGITNWLW